MLSLATRTIRIALIGSIALLVPKIASAVTIAIPFKPSNFSHPLRIDNKYFKLIPGTTQLFRSRQPGEGCETIRTTVTNDTKQIAGINARVVHDVAFEDPKCNGDLSKIEDTFDYYAQDDAGNIWYMGETSRDCEDGKCTLSEGSWIAGKDIFDTGTKAKAGIQMLANPKEGDSYFQEKYPGHAVDQAKIAATGVTVRLTRKNALPPKVFRNCVKIKEFSTLDPGITAFKYYCPKVGFVLETETGDFRLERIKEPEDDAFKFRSAP